jgi:hypothetical protein
MMTNLPIRFLCGLCLALGGQLGPGVPPSAAAELPKGPVTVEVQSGRTFTAEVDSRTDSAQLWLRFGQGAMVLLRPIAWEQVVQAQVGEERLSGQQFLEVLKPPQRTGDGPPRIRGGSLRIVPMGPTATGLGGAPGFGSQVSSATTAQPEETRPPRVRSLAIEARVANWDFDVEMDGLIVDVYPLDEFGQAVPVRGSLVVTLVGRHDSKLRRTRSLGQVGRWSKQVRPADFRYDGFQYRLPFRTVRPEFDLEWDSHGLVHARLSVPGQGVFEASESTVRIRPYSAFRDDLQLSTGKRFLRLENPRRGQ